MKKQLNFPHCCYWLSLICYIACLCLPTYSLDRVGHESPLGGELLLIGGLGLFVGYFSWLANPAYLLALVLGFVKHPRIAALVSVIGLALALSFLLQKKILINEAGHEALIVGYGWGYWLWLAALAVLTIGTTAAGMFDKAVKSPVPAEK